MAGLLMLVRCLFGWARGAWGRDALGWLVGWMAGLLIELLVRRLGGKPTKQSLLPCQSIPSPPSNQPTNQPTNTPRNQALPYDQQAKQATSKPTNQSTSQPNNAFIPYRPANQLSRPADPTAQIGRPPHLANQSTNQSVSRPANQTTNQRTADQPTDRPTD